MMFRIVFFILEKYCMTPARIQFQHNFCSALEELLQVEYRSDCQLRLFGSAVNNFGFDDSDVDLCLTFAEPSLPSVCSN